MVDSRVRYGGVAILARPLTCFCNSLPNCVDLCFGKKIYRLIESQAIASRPPVAMMEVSIGGDMNISTCSKRSPIGVPAETCGASLDEEWQAGIGGERVCDVFRSHGGV